MNDEGKGYEMKEIQQALVKYWGYNSFCLSRREA